MAILWGLIIVAGSEFLKYNANAKTQLLTLGQYLQTISNQTDGWGDGILGAIGLKKESITKK